MPLAPEVFGIGFEIQEAILEAQNIGKNIEREIYFPGEYLKLYSMSPTGETLLQELSEDWTARREDPNEDSEKNSWMFEIIEQRDVSEDNLRAVTHFKIGTKTYKITKRESPTGNLGMWLFRAQIIGEGI